MTQSTRTNTPTGQTVMTSETINLGNRINAIRAAVKRVSKDAKVEGKYDAVTHDAVTTMLRPLMAEHGVIDSISLASREIEDPDVMWGKRKLLQYRGTYVYTVYNADDLQDKIDITVEGFGDDNGDKGPGKAMSYAKKYGQMKMFAIETGEDDEQRVDHKELAEGHLNYMHQVRENWESINAIKDNLATENVDEARDIFKTDFDSTIQSVLWRAPTKGGIFSTAERKLLKEGKPA